LSEPLRVLSISTLFPSPTRPGFGLFVARQAQAVAARGDVDLVVAHPIAIAPPPFHRFFNNRAERKLPSEGRDWGVEVHYPRFAYLPRIGWRWNPALIARAVLPLARDLHRQKPFDVVDAQFFYPDGPAAARVARALGLPLSIKARGSDIHLWGGRPAALEQMLRAAEQAAGLLSVSQALKADMAALGMPESRIAVHYTGLDHALFQPRPRVEARAALAAHPALRVPADGPLLVTVGNLIPLKGQHLVIEALATLPGTRLVLAGKGPEDAALRMLADRLGLADRVHLAGGVKPADLALLLAAADAMVLPSEREGLANAWIEALACGTPLVITDVGGAREVVRHSSAGRVVGRSADAIAAGVREVLANPPGEEETAANAARFSWDANAAQLADHWRAIASSPI
jgi:glycosyltransferase involved in cell wall biosynthesis